MSKKKCGMIHDLLPLYAENICGEESRNVVTEHLSHCEECRNMLDKMNMSVGVSVDNDITAMKKIKWKIGIKRIIAVIVSAVVVYVCCLLLIVYKLSPVTLPYENSMENYITVNTDSNGDVWIGRIDRANDGFLFHTISDSNGRHFSYDDDFDSNAQAGYGFSIMQERYKNNYPFNYFAISEEWQYSRLFNMNDKPEIEYVFYYDVENDTEHILWEKNK